MQQNNEALFQIDSQRVPERSSDANEASFGECEAAESEVQSADGYEPSEGENEPSESEIPSDAERARELTADDVKKLVYDALALAAKERDEAEKLAKMSKEEREEHERKTREDDYQKRLADVTRRELRIEAHKALKEKNLPVELLDALRYDGAESCMESMEAIEKAFRAAVELGVNDRLRGKPPGASRTLAGLTEDTIKSMTAEEIAANMAEVEKALTDANA